MTAALIPVGIGLGSKLLGGLFGGGKPKTDPRAEELNNRFLSALNPTQKRADTASDYFLKNAMSFDPTAALETYGKAAYGDFQSGLKKNLADLESSAVGAGRLDTGFYDEDQGQLIKDTTAQYQRDLAGQAMNAAALQQRNTEAVGSYGTGEQNTYLDMLSGALDRAQAAKNAKNQNLSNLLGAGIQALGTYAGAKWGGK